jgi:hypothetical protein
MPLTHHQADALLHLARRLVGEGDGEDFRGPRPPGGEDVGNAGGQHPRLAGAGTGQHQHRAVERLDRLPLLGIEIGEVIDAGARRHGARGDAAGRGRRRLIGLERLLRGISQATALPKQTCQRESWTENGTRGLDLRGLRIHKLSAAMDLT